MKKIFTLFVIAITIQFSSNAQSCMFGWNYYRPITINNPNATVLSNFQVLLSVNTAAIVSAGHMSATGDDMRFLSTSVCCQQIPYWIESGMNTAATQVWVKIPSIPANGSVTINLYSGNVAAVSASNASTVFDLYEDFSGPTYHFAQDGCGSGTATQSAGQMACSWSSSAVWTSDSIFSLANTYTAEANVTAASGNWPGLHWLKTTNQQGYGDLLGGSQFRFSVTGASTGYCQGHNWAGPIYPAGIVTGLWSVTWVATGNIVGTMPGVGNVSTTDATWPKDASMKLVLGGISGGVGSITYDWVRVRKYATVSPTAAVGSESGYVGAPANFLGADQLICGAGTIVLDASGNGFSSYAWSTAATTPSISVSSSGNYWVNGTDATGCLIADTVAVSIGAAPTVSVTASPTAICVGDASTLTASGASTYLWQPSNTTGATYTDSPIITTTYSVTGTAVNGCTTTQTVVLTVNALPTVVATISSATICSGNSVTLTGSGATTYLWQPINQTGSPISDTPSSNTTYTVTGTDANGCVNTSSITVNVNLNPVVTAASNLPTICAGDSVVLSATGASTYNWMPGNINGAPVIDYPSTSSTYTVTGTDANGCIGLANVVVVVTPLPIIVATTSNPVICMDQVTTLMATGASSLIWTPGNYTGSPVTVVPIGTTTYTVTGTANNCSSSDSITITVNSLPVITTSATSINPCLSDAVVALTASPVGGTWSGTGITASTFSPSTAGVGFYQLIYSYTNSNGCSSADTLGMTVNACVGLSEVTLVNTVSVFPNPNNGVFNLNVNANYAELIIEVTDLQGRVIYSSIENNVVAGFSKQINLENFASGLYSLKLTSGNEQIIEKIAVQK